MEKVCYISAPVTRNKLGKTATISIAKSAVMLVVWCILPQCWSPLGFPFMHFPIPACCTPHIAPTLLGLCALQGQPGAGCPWLSAPSTRGTHRAEAQPGWAMGTGPRGAGEAQLSPVQAEGSTATAGAWQGLDPSGQTPRLFTGPHICWMISEE